MTTTGMLGHGHSGLGIVCADAQARMRLAFM